MYDVWYFIQKVVEYLLDHKFQLLYVWISVSLFYYKIQKITRFYFTCDDFFLLFFIKVFLDCFQGKYYCKSEDNYAYKFNSSGSELYVSYLYANVTSIGIDLFTHEKRVL